MSCVAARFGMGFATVGASFVLATVIVNVSLADPPLPSDAVIRTLTAPTSPFAGVPLKVRVAALNDSHAGSADPSARVAAYVSVSPASTSVNVFDANWKLKGASSVAP